MNVCLNIIYVYLYVDCAFSVYGNVIHFSKSKKCLCLCDCRFRIDGSQFMSTVILVYTTNDSEYSIHLMMGVMSVLSEQIIIVLFFSFKLK